MSQIPEGATHRSQDHYYRKEGSVWRLYGSAAQWIETACHWKWLEENAEPLTPAWTGEGLPPVGTTCETRFTDIEGSSWRGAIILAHGARRIFLRENSGDEFAQRIDECEFRPFRTPEQIAAEEREAEILEIFHATGLRKRDGGKEVAEAIYRAGYRKQSDL